MPILCQNRIPRNTLNNDNPGEISKSLNFSKVLESDIRVPFQIQLNKNKIATIISF